MGQVYMISRIVVGMVMVLIVSPYLYADDDSCKNKVGDVAKQIGELETIVKKVQAPKKNLIVTSKGAKFEVLGAYGKFKRAVKAPDGTIWSENMGHIDNSSAHSKYEKTKNGRVVDSLATQICKAKGGHLPTMGEYEKLMESFERDDGFLTDQGEKDFFRVFPDMCEGQGDGAFLMTILGGDFYAYDFSGCSGIFQRSAFEGFIRCADTPDVKR